MIISIPGQDNTFADMVTRSFSGSMWRRHCFRWVLKVGGVFTQQSACFWGQGLWKYKNPNKKVCAQKCIYKILWRRHWCGWVLKVGGLSGGGGVGELSRPRPFKLASKPHIVDTEDRVACGFWTSAVEALGSKAFQACSLANPIFVSFWWWNEHSCGNEDRVSCEFCSMCTSEGSGFYIEERKNCDSRLLNSSFWNFVAFSWPNTDCNV